jgi:drug/metabolite transporter (DMT)-like permease
VQCWTNRSIINPSSRNQTIGLVGSVIAAVLWGFGGIFAALTFAPGLVLCFYRLWLGAVLLAIISSASGRRVTWATLKASWLGGILLAGDMALFYSAVKLASIVDVTVIGAFQPILVILAARRLFQERLVRWDVFWIVLAMCGVLATVLGPGTANRHQLLGDLLAVGSLLCWSAYWLVTKHARDVQGTMQYTAAVTMMAAVVITPVVLVSGQSLGHVKVGDVTWIVLLAVVPGAGHLIMNWAHRYVDASISSILGCLSPLVAAVAAIPILGQSLSASQVAGVLIGLGAIAAVAARHRQPTPSQLE